MKAKAWLVLIGVALAAALAAWAVSPVIAFNNLVEAARAGNRGRLERLVDFPAVRESLKAQLSARVQRAVGGGPLGGLGALIAPSVVDQVVEAAVTPDGIAAIMRSGRAPLSEVRPGKSALPPPAETAAPADPDAAPEPVARPKVRFAYAGPNSFQAATTPKGLGGEPITWIMTRQGLFGWKLTAIALPGG